MTETSFETLIADQPSITRFLRDSPRSSRVDFRGVPREFTHWKKEQHSWRERAAFLDQSHHMTDLFLEGPGALAFLQKFGAGKLADFPVGRARQYFAVAPDGNMIGDAIVFHTAENSFDVVGVFSVPSWLQYQLESGDYDVEWTLDPNSNVRAGDPVQYRYEVQGPKAKEVLEAAIGGELPDIGFFHLTDVTIAGRTVHALRHGMAGHVGLELFGPWEDAVAVREALFEVGEPLGLTAVGTRAYFTLNIESGWIPLVAPAIFTSPETAGFRRWLPPAPIFTIGGSFAPENIEDYYVTPYDLGYGKFLELDREFVGRDALVALADAPRRRKVSLIWNQEDIAAAFEKSFDLSGLPAKELTLEKLRYAFIHYDSVMAGERRVGFSIDGAYFDPDRLVVSLAIVDEEFAEPGTEVIVLWGESEDARSAVSEDHEQVQIRAVVAPSPFSEFARTTYRTSVAV
ncbi:MAG TPA: aminomethyl transferase family protein [Microbacteriaceae bacterium]|nr:aminomethyl transferase family protein [Microbacteriaceae bacterium]